MQRHLRSGLWTLILALGALATVTPAEACGPRSDCKLGDRYYRVKMPDGHDGQTPVGAIVFAHGYKGNGRGWVRNKRLVAVANELGVAIIGLKSSGDGWSLPGSPAPGRVKADEVAYVLSVVDDVTARFAIDDRRLLATGFSAGGMMVWTLACHASERFAAFAPIAGTFWEPTPETCTTPPASIMHVHGTKDRTVPLTGRKVRDAKQGDVATVLAMYTRYGRFEQAREYTSGRLSCTRKRNAAKQIFDYCLFDGGHRFSVDDVRHAWVTLMR